eukprot:Seg5950.2 transcript_id=Seg5950.2/GoldUCD/mRNA.D3Y31 product="F-box protein" protein_id=Seg5950.2/GoldUCD/D3Y31
MAPTQRKAKTTANAEEKSPTSKQQKAQNSSPKPAKLKLKRKSKQSNKWIGFGILMLAVGIFVGLAISGKFDLLSILSSKKKFVFPRAEIPEFNISRGIERRSNLSLEEFIKLYDAKWPVLVTDAMKNWPALRKWNKNFFMINYGNEAVSFKGVQGKIRQGLATKFGLFLQHVHESSPNQWSYAEDEVFLVRNPELREDIKTPIYLEEDFFQLLPQEIRPWNAMILWGTAYSRSTLHIDPYNWTGTNAVLKGRKLWKLYPPGQDHLLYGTRKLSGFPLECPKYQSPVDTFDVNKKKFPLFKKAKAIEFAQLPGEMLFIPTGWFHQAYNAEETLAISSQVWNSQNNWQVMEEIVKGENVKPEDLPSNFDSLSPREQAETLISLFPNKIIENGRRVNRDVMDQLDKIGASERVSA